MSEDIYRKLAGVLNSLPNDFPPSESGAELKLLRKIFTPAEAELFCDLRLTGETAEDISARTGRAVEGLGDMLGTMYAKGQIVRDREGAALRYRMVPWILGIYEYQLPNLDREFAELHLEYMRTLGIHLFTKTPQIMQVLPIEKEIPNMQEALPYQQVSALIERSRSFAVNHCICKTQNGLMGRGCAKPREVCLAIAEEENYYNDHPMKPRLITKEEAYEILRTAEEAGLVHMTQNTQKGHWFICNCCGCCCGQLIAARKGVPGAVNSSYTARIDALKCTQCDTCFDRRCQIKAISKEDGYNAVNEAKCIGCGLCVSACPSKAAGLYRKDTAAITPPPADEMDWYEKRAKLRGIDYSRYK